MANLQSLAQSLAIGNEEARGSDEEEALLQLTGQEEALLPGPAGGGDELELLEPPPRSRPAEDATLIDPGDWNSASPPGGARGSTATGVSGAWPPALLFPFGSRPATRHMGALSHALTQCTGSWQNRTAQAARCCTQRR